MTSQPDPRPGDQPPPFRSWPGTYLAVAALAVAVMALLWWFTATFDIPLPRR